MGEDGAASKSKSDAWEGAGEGKPVEKWAVEVDGLVIGVVGGADVDGGGASADCG